MTACRPHKINIIVPDLEYFNASVCAGIYQNLSHKNYSICICLTNEHPEQEKLCVENTLMQKDAVGIVLFSCIHDAYYYQEVLQRAEIPIVFVDRLSPYLSHSDFVTIDNYGGAYKIGKLLIEKGVKQIVCLSTLHQNKISSVEDRINGLKDICASHPYMSYVQENLEYTDLVSSLEDVLQKWNKEGFYPDSIFAVNHLVLNAYLSLIHKHMEWRERAAQSIISCFDDVDYFNWIDMPIISVSQPIQDIVYYVCYIIQKRIEQYSNSQRNITHFANIILPVKVIDRYQKVR